MKKTTKIGLSVALSLVGSIGVTTAVIVSQTQQKAKVIKNSETDSVKQKFNSKKSSNGSTTLQNKSSGVVDIVETTPSYDLNDPWFGQPINPETFRLDLKIENLNNLGTTTFELSGNDEFINANYEQEVVMKVAMNDSINDTVLDIRVHDMDNKSWDLGIEMVNETTYKFKLPPQYVEIDGKRIKNPFYQTGKMNVQIIYGKKQINAFTYEFNSRSYAYMLHNDKIWNANKDETLLMKPVDHMIPTQYTIYLNDFDLTLDRFMVPKGVQVHFKNKSKTPILSNEVFGKVPTKTPIIKTDTEAFYDRLCMDMQGSLTRWEGVEYSQYLKGLLEWH